MRNPNLAVAGGVEPAELSGLRSVIVGGVLLDVAELEQLDVLLHRDVSEGVGPDYSEEVENTRDLDIWRGMTLTLRTLLAVYFQNFRVFAILINILNWT